MKKHFAIVLLMAVVSTAWAQRTNQGFYGGKEEGWFWYKDPREAKEKLVPPPQIQPPSPPPQAPAQTPAAPDRVPTFSVKWLRENLDKLRDVAIDDPSPENVRAYYYAQRVMLDKADKFATASQQVVLSDPYLDENNNFPYASTARNSVMKLRDSAKKEGLKYLTEKVGLWFFFDSKCSFCSMQLSVVKHLAQDYGFLVKAISLDGKSLPGLDLPVVRDQGQFRNLNLSVTPSLVMVVPPKTFLVVSQGVLSDESADDRILTIAASQKLLPDELNRQIDVFGKGVLSAEDLNNEEAKALRDDPKAWVQYLQGRLKSKY